MDSHREVVHDAQTHPGAPRALDRRKLLVYQPLKPALELDLGHDHVGTGQRRRVGMLQLRRPLGKPRPMMRPAQPRWRSSAGSTPSRRRYASKEVSPARCPRHREENGQRLALGLPRAVSIDRRSRVEINHQFLDACRSWSVGRCWPARTRNSLDAQVERIGETSAGGQVGRGLHRWHRRGVHRIDQHVIAAVLSGRPHGRSSRSVKSPTPQD